MGTDGLTDKLPGKPESATFPWFFLSTYIIFNTIPPCLQTGERTALKEQEWRSEGKG